jgi:hypothetical protein
MMMMHRVTALIGLSALAILAGCADDDGSDTTGGQTPAPTVEELYQAAVDDAEVADADEIVDTLTAINAQNTDLVRDSSGRVLMITWTSYPGYDDIVGQETQLGVEVWTTVGREMEDFCADLGLQGADLSLRLEQLLGLPPDNGKDRVVELWVPEDALFRPSPDMEITDSVAQLDFPASTPQEHIDWIDNLEASSYGEGGYPWTRLGYTYDWSPDAASEVGLSEFVVLKGSTVMVESVTPTDEYCR